MAEFMTEGNLSYEAISTAEKEELQVVLLYQGSERFSRIRITLKNYNWFWIRTKYKIEKYICRETRICMMIYQIVLYICMKMNRIILG